MDGSSFRDFAATQANLASSPTGGTPATADRPANGKPVVTAPQPDPKWAADKTLPDVVMHGVI